MRTRQAEFLQWQRFLRISVEKTVETCEARLEKDAIAGMFD